MEQNSNDHGSSSSQSWWLDHYNRPPRQSHWLQSTMSEFNKKIKTMLNLIEDDGDTFAIRAEMFYQKRPELIRLIEDLHRSFCMLADKYDQLVKSESIRSSNYYLGSPSVSSSQLFQNCPISATQEIATEDDQLSHPHSHPDSDHSDVDDVGKLEKEGDTDTAANDYNSCARMGMERMEDKWQLQADELVTKVHESVKGLCARIDQLETENSILKNSCRTIKVEIKPSRSSISRVKEAILKKLLR